MGLFVKSGALLLGAQTRFCPGPEGLGASTSRAGSACAPPSPRTKSSVGVSERIQCEGRGCCWCGEERPVM